MQRSSTVKQDRTTGAEAEVYAGGGGETARYEGVGDVGIGETGEGGADEAEAGGAVVVGGSGEAGDVETGGTGGIEAGKIGVDEADEKVC